MDHQSLEYILQQRVSTPLQQKWLTKLMGYDFEIKYKKGGEKMWLLMHYQEEWKMTLF